MIEPVKRVIRRHWPRLRLRTILLLTFTFVAALPGVGALFLRVYENALIRQTEAELVAQGSALAAAATVAWDGDTVPIAGRQRPAAIPSLDLRLTPILPALPDPRPAAPIDDRRTRDWQRRVAPVLRLTAQATGAATLLLDGQGHILIGPHAGEGYGSLPEVRITRTGRTATTLRRDPSYRPRYPGEWLSRAAGLRIHHAHPIVAGGQVIGIILLSHPPRALFAGLDADRGKIALGIVLIFAILVVLSGLLSRGIVRPVEALGTATRAVATGGGVVPDAPTTAAIEIQALYHDFASMAGAIERRSRYLRDFAHAVSHEFKTPLTGIGGAVELLQDHPDMAPADRDRFLTNIGGDAARLTALVNRLLDLARADMAEAADDIATDIGDVVRRIVDAHRQPDFSIDCDCPADLPVVTVTAAALESILTGLIENSRQAGASRLTITARDIAGSIDLTVGDDGPGIPPSDRERIFEPFFTSRRGSGGTGLGLPIARSLLAAHGGTIDLVQGNGGGTMFGIALPVHGRQAMA